MLKGSAEGEALENDNPICELCTQPGGELLWEDSECRVVRVADPDYPGFCRVIWKAHVREISDLDPSSQLRLMRVVIAVERTVRRLFAPDKINLASFGNLVPHLHWHVIPRFTDDAHFPHSVWSAPQRAGVERKAPAVETLSATLVAMLTEQTAG